MHLAKWRSYDYTSATCRSTVREIYHHAHTYMYKFIDGFRWKYRVAAVRVLNGKQGDILQLPGVMYLDCHTDPALQVPICTTMYVWKSIHRHKRWTVRHPLLVTFFLFFARGLHQNNWWSPAAEVDNNFIATNQGLSQSPFPSFVAWWRVDERGGGVAGTVVTLGNDGQWLVSYGVVRIFLPWLLSRPLWRNG